MARESRFALIAPATAVVAYLPAVVVPYAFMDDYYVLAWREGLAGEFFKTATSFGRPLHAVALSATFSLAWDVESLRLTRLVSLVGVMLVAVLIYYALRRAGFSRWLSVGACVSVISLASFQVYVSWAAIGEAPYVAALAGVAWFVLRSAWSLHGSAALIRRAGAVVLLLAALLTYQPAAMFFWVFAAIDVLRPGGRLAHASRQFAEGLAVAAVAAFFAYAAVRVGVHFYGGAFSGRTSLVHDFVGKARWFWNEPLVNSLGLFGLLPTESVALAVALVAAAGVVLLHAPRGWGNAFGFLGLAAAFVPLAYLPNLAVAEQFASYRSIGALASLLTLYLWVGLQGIAHAARSPWTAVPLAALLSFAALGVAVVPLLDPTERVSVDSLATWPELAAFGLLFAASVATALFLPRRAAIAAMAVAGTAFAIIGLLIAARNVTTLFVRPQSAELHLLRTELDAAAPRRVVFVKPNWNQGAAPLVRYDEFGLPSTYFAWVPPPAVLLVLDGKAHPMIDVFAWDEVPATRGGAFVDMRKLRKRRVDWSLWTLERYAG